MSEGKCVECGGISSGTLVIKHPNGTRIEKGPYCVSCVNDILSKTAGSNYDWQKVINSQQSIMPADTSDNAN